MKHSVALGPALSRLTLRICSMQGTKGPGHQRMPHAQSQGHSADVRSQPPALPPGCCRDVTVCRGAAVMSRGLCRYLANAQVSFSTGQALVQVGDRGQRRASPSCSEAEGQAAVRARSRGLPALLTVLWLQLSALFLVPNSPGPSPMCRPVRCCVRHGVLVPAHSFPLF